MRNISVTDFIQDGRKSLEQKNYMSSLSVALLLPGICSRLMYKDVLDENGTPKYYCKSRTDGSIHWYDSKCYRDFCNMCFSDDGWLKNTLGDQYAEVLYNQLRCGVIHEGNIEICVDNKPLYFQINNHGCDSTTLSKTILVSIETLCETIFDGVEIWYENYCSNHKVHGCPVLDMETSEDKSLYKTLIDEEKNNKTISEFKENLNQRTTKS